MLSCVLCSGSGAVYFVSGNMLLLSLGDPVSPSPWVGCDPASLQLLRVADSHPGAHAIRGMYFSALYALCPFLKFSKNLTGHRSSHWIEANDKNSHWYAGHLKILAAVWSYLEDSLVCSKNFEIFLLSRCRQKRTERAFMFKEKRAGGGLMMKMSFSTYVTSYCWENVRVQGRDCGHQILQDLKGPLTLTEQSVLISTM